MFLYNSLIFSEMKRETAVRTAFLMEELLRKFAIPQYQIGLFSISAYVHSDTSPVAGRYCKTGARKFRVLEHNSVRSSSFFMYHKFLTSRNSTFCLNSVFMCSVRISEQKAICFPIQHYLVGFYNRDGVCLLHGTD